MEYDYSERAQEVTRQIDMWVNNDSDYYFVALDYARNDDIESLKEFLTEALKHAAEGSAPWYVTQDMSPNDYDRINWQGIMESLTVE